MRAYVCAQHSEVVTWAPSPIPTLRIKSLDCSPGTARGRAALGGRVGSSCERSLQWESLPPPPPALSLLLSAEVQELGQMVPRPSKPTSDELWAGGRTLGVCWCVTEPHRLAVADG